jgi:thiol-disulfide isomerase/thioredoxin
MNIEPDTPPTARPDEPAAKPRRRGAVALVAAGAAAAAFAGLAAVYGIAGFGRNPGDAACRPAVATAQRITPLMHGEVAALNPASEPLRLPPLAFQDAGGAGRTLTDWRGRTVLLNLWATWCVPCRKEMPALDALERKLGDAHFEVVSINIDTRDPAKPKAWLNDAGVQKLAYYADPSAKVFQDLKMIGKAIGMPTTLLVDPNGCEIATIAGPAEWASDDAVKLIGAALGREHG